MSEKSKTELKSCVVVFADIVSWSAEDASKQRETVMDLIGKMVRLIGESAIKPFWTTGTGDGFALAFAENEREAVIHLTARLLEEVISDRRYRIRLSASCGRVRPYHNALTNRDDICGPAVIVARRLLEAAAEGWFLIEDHLAAGLAGVDSQTWRGRLLPSRQYRAKHGLLIYAQRFIPEGETQSYADIRKGDVAPNILTIAAQLGAGPHSSITETAARLSTRLIGVHRFLIRWMDGSLHGLAPDAVSVNPKWHPETLGSDGGILAPLDPRILAAIRPITLSAEIDAMVGSSNKPKVSLKDMRLPTSDQPSLRLTVGRTDYRTSKAVQTAFERPVTFDGQEIASLLEAFEQRLLDVDDDLPGMIAPAMALLTNDDCLVFAQRGKKAVDRDFSPGRFSPSCEEQWNPETEHDPHDAILRCLREEWNIGSARGIEVAESSIKLVAIGREWGTSWHTVLIYIVDLPCSAAEVLESWNSVPEDRAEAVAVGAVPVRTAAQRRIILDIVKSRRVRPRELIESCGATWCGNPSDNELHDSTGAARILFALAHRFGVESLTKASLIDC